jgi:hypothetical protein
MHRKSDRGVEGRLGGLRVRGDLSSSAIADFEENLGVMRENERELMFDDRLKTLTTSLIADLDKNSAWMERDSSNANGKRLSLIANIAMISSRSEGGDHGRNC